MPLVFHQIFNDPHNGLQTYVRPCGGKGHGGINLLLKVMLLGKAIEEKGKSI
jgi:hypothetical protein